MINENSFLNDDEEDGEEEEEEEKMDQIQKI